MNTAPTELVAQLDRLSEALEKTDAANQRALRTLLADRDQVVKALLEAATPMSPAVRDSLARAWEVGDRVRQRLLVHGAGTREQLGNLYRSGCLLRALSAERRETAHMNVVG